MKHSETEKTKGDDTRNCESCLFYVDAMPNLIVCIGGTGIKTYASVRTKCRKWVENTPENADELLKLLEDEN